MPDWRPPRPLPFRAYPPDRAGLGPITTSPFHTGEVPIGIWDHFDGRASMLTQRPRRAALHRRTPDPPALVLSR